jgi:hypothetical protein
MRENLTLTIISSHIVGRGSSIDLLAKIMRETGLHLTRTRQWVPCSHTKQALSHPFSGIPFPVDVESMCKNGKPILICLWEGDRAYEMMIGCVGTNDREEWSEKSLNAINTLPQDPTPAILTSDPKRMREDALMLLLPDDF